MMAKNEVESPVQPAPVCKRCKTEPATHDIRSELVCSECFCKYVETKVVKRLETFRVRHAEPGNPRKVLVAMSFGTCSTSMLHILQQNIERQMARTGRSGYDLHVLYLKTQSTEESSQRWLDSLKSTYPRYEFSMLNILDENVAIESRPPVVSETNGFDIGTHSTTNGSSTTLLDLLDSASSLTSHSDILNITLMRSIVQQAQTMGCESIVWGDSTTRLAEKILAETAKGRGSGLPYLITDGPSPFGIDFHYPMRDLLRKEVAAYAAARNLPVFKPADPKSVRNTAISSKTMSIDGLMSDYFESVEETYPSIVANVVRTSSKLDAKNDDNEKEPCGICSMPVDKHAFGFGNWKGNQSSTVSIEKPKFCYACSRSVQLKPRS